MSVKWAEQFKRFLGCVRCGSDTNLNLKYHNGQLVEVAEQQFEALTGGLDEFDVWCDQCEHKYLRLRLFSKTRLARKEEASEFASIRIYSHYKKGGMAYNTYTLDANLRISKRDFLHLAKLDAPCQRCGNVFIPAAMDFHHVTGERVCDVASMPGGHWTLKNMIDEMEKCILVCATCHRIIHAERISGEELAEKAWKFSEMDQKLADWSQKGRKSNEF